MDADRGRIWQVDFLRGVAVVGMVAYHFLFDLEFIFQLPIGVYRMPLLLLSRTVAAIFLLIVGFSAAVKFERLKHGTVRKVIASFGRKAAFILAPALLVTGATFATFPEQTVLLGILHFIALSLVLIIPFLYIKSNRTVFSMGILFLYLGSVLSNLRTDNIWLLVFGVTPYSFSSFDYFPIFPWFGVILFGLALGRRYGQVFQTAKTPSSSFAGQIILLGKHSLLIYLLHQPVLWAVLLIVKNL